MHSSISEVFAQSPAARRPVSRLSGWFAFMIFALVFGLTMASILLVGATSTSSDVFYTKDQLRELTMDKTPAEVIALLGPPARQTTAGPRNRTTYVYMRLVRNRPTTIVAPEARIHFLEDESGSLVAISLSTSCFTSARHDHP